MENPDVNTRFNSNEAPEWCLSVTSPDGSSVIFALDRPRLVIGRSPECDIVLGSEAISRRHAEIFHDPFGRWWIHDLGSRNGVIVNGQRVSEQALLPNVAVRIDQHTLHCVPIANRRLKSPAEIEQCALHDTADLVIQTLKPMEESRLATSYLFALLDLDRLLMETPDSESRRALLCDMLTRHPFTGNAVMFLRIDRNAPRSPHVIGAIKTRAGFDQSNLHISRRLIERVAESGQPMLASNTGTTDAQVEMSIESTVERMSASAAPVRADSLTLDILYIVLPPDSSPQEWLALTALAARHFSRTDTLLNSRERDQMHAMIEKDLDRAHGIQLSLLPGKLETPGIDAAWCYEPCRWVGGDYLDVLRLDDGRVFLGVADVCGKGMQAALVSSLLHTLVQSLLAVGLKLSRVMRRTSIYLSTRLHSGAFVTMLGVIINPATGRVEVANAGHPELIRISADGKPLRLTGGVNLPLGMVNQSDMEIQTQTLALAPGEWLMLYTDGWTDMKDANGERLGSEHFLELVRQTFSDAPKASAQEILQRFTAAIEAFRGQAMPIDDRTLLIAKWNPVAS